MRKTGRKIIGLLLVACMTGSSFFGIGTQSVTDVVQAATDSEINIQIKPDAETFVNGGSVDFNGNNESQILIGRKRYFFSR